MDGVNLFALAATQAKWLSARQTAVANNIANAYSPGYRSTDVEPFESLLSGTGVHLGATSASHFGGGGSGVNLVEEEGPKTTTTGKPVSMEEELVKSGEIRRDFELNTAVVSAFNRMLLMTAKS